MEPVLFTLLITCLLVAAVVWVVFHLIALTFRVVFWVLKTPFRIGRHLMVNASSRPVLTMRCANRRCGARLREEGRFCHRCGQAVAVHEFHYDGVHVAKPVTRVA